MFRMHVKKLTLARYPTKRRPGPKPSLQPYFAYLRNNPWPSTPLGMMLAIC